MVGLYLDGMLLLDALYVRFVTILNVRKEIQAEERKLALMRVKRDGGAVNPCLGRKVAIINHR